MDTRVKQSMNSKAQFWDKQAKKFDKTENRFDPAFENILKKTEKYLKKTDLVLDFGCATGKKSLELAQYVNEVHGLDFSPKMIELAEEEAKKQKISNVKFFNGTIFDELLMKGSYEAIVSFGVIHLLDDYIEVLKRINELLKPDGFFISTTACLRETMSLRDKFVLSNYLFIKKIGLFQIYLNMLKNSDVDRMIEEANFKIVESENIASGISIYFVVAKKSKQSEL